MRNKHSQRGISLIEVIVIILLLAVIAGAVSLLIPGLGPHTKYRNQMHCLSNLKQIGMGLILYENEFGVMPPQGPKSLLYADGSGYVPDSNIFNCPAVEKHHPMGDYLRDVNWDGEAKANKVIVGDVPENHGYEAYSLLFKDGHVFIYSSTGNPPKTKPVKNVDGAADPDDGIYSGDGDSDSTQRTWLKIRD